jgi:hypothetical protein
LESLEYGLASGSALNPFRIIFFNPAKITKHEVFHLRKIISNQIKFIKIGKPTLKIHK